MAIGGVGIRGGEGGSGNCEAVAEKFSWAVTALPSSALAAADAELATSCKGTMTGTRFWSIMRADEGRGNGNRGCCTENEMIKRKDLKKGGMRLHALGGNADRDA